MNEKPTIGHCSWSPDFQASPVPPKIPSAAITPESGATPLVGTGSWIGELLRKEADEWDKVAAAFDEPTPTDKGNEWRRMAAHADAMHAALAQAKTLLCEKHEFEAAAKLSELLKTSSPIRH